MAGQLAVATSFEGFSGRGVGWFNADTVIAFAERLTEYPLNTDEPIRLSGGIGAGEDYQEFVGLHVILSGIKGQIMVLVHVAAEDWRDAGPVPVHETRLEFPTSYEYLGRFGRHLARAVHGELHEARLDPDILI